MIVEPPPSGGLYCDRPDDGDNRIDNYDLAAIWKYLSNGVPVPVTSANAWANYRTDSVISRADYDDCKYVFGGRLPKKFY